MSNDRNILKLVPEAASSRYVIASVFQVSLALMVWVLSAKPSKPAAMASEMS